MNATINRISDQRILDTLSSLHRDSKLDGLRMMKAMAKSRFRKFKPEDAKHAYLPISKEQGNYIYDLIIEKDFKNIIEFGTSFGISTIYMAAAALQTNGKVLATEIVAEKCTRALENFSKAGVESVIDLKQGDAIETLKTWNGPVDFLLLDGWKDLYLPIFEMLEIYFHNETIIYVDNANFPEVQDFLRKVSKLGKYELSQVNLSDGKCVLIKLKNN